jgi:hypothetical protein
LTSGFPLLLLGVKTELLNFVEERQIFCEAIVEWNYDSPNSGSVNRISYIYYPWMNT